MRLEVVVSIFILPRDKHDILSRLNALALECRRFALAARAPDINRRGFLRFERLYPAFDGLVDHDTSRVLAFFTGPGCGHFRPELLIGSLCNKLGKATPIKTAIIEMHEK